MLSQALLRWLGDTVALSILAGVKVFDEAFKEAAAARDRQTSDEAFMTRLRNTAPDLAELVTEVRRRSLLMKSASSAFARRLRTASAPPSSG
jgi:hypothetical protein